MQLNMFGGVTPTPSSGGDDTALMEGIYSGRKKEEKEMEERLKRLRQEDEDWVLILAQWVVENNSN